MNEPVVYSIRENKLYEDIRAIIEEARNNAIRSVDFNRVLMYWKTGRRVFEEEQKGADRADYGTYLISNLAKRLEPGYGSGFTKRQLYFSLQFYKTYPKVNALRSQLNWTQYRSLIQITDPDKREYYELETANNGLPTSSKKEGVHMTDRNSWKPPGKYTKRKDKGTLLNKVPRNPYWCRSACQYFSTRVGSRG